MITTTDILTRLQAACAADSALIGVVQARFGMRALLTLQLGGDPTHEVTSQDCPLIAFLDGGPADTGRQSEQWRWPLELQVYICDSRIDTAPSAPLGTRLITVTGPAALDALCAALRTACQAALSRMGLVESSWLSEIEPPMPATWPRQRAIITITATANVCLGAEPALYQGESA